MEKKTKFWNFQIQQKTRLFFFFKENFLLQFSGFK